MARKKVETQQAGEELNARDEDLIREIIGRIDLNLPEAARALDELHARGAATFEYEMLAEEYPFGFADGFRPVSSTKHLQVVAMLRQSMSSSKAELVIRTGREVEAYRSSRIPTGNANLDNVLGGGVKRGVVTQFKGGPSHGKSFACLQVAAEVLRRGGHVLWLALEPFDTDWARKCGVPIHYASPEPGSDEERYNQTHPRGLHFDLIVGEAGNAVLQTVCNAVKLNAWDLIVIDSIATAISRVHLEGKEVGDSLPGGEAFMINQFMSRLQTAFNSVEANVGRVLNKSFLCTTCGETFNKKNEHEKCPPLEKGKPKFEENQEVGDPPRAGVILVNQLRAQGIGASMPVAPDANGGMGLQHGKSVDVLFSGAVQLKTTVDGDEVVFGVVSTIKTTKNKTATPHLEGVFEIWVRDVEGVAIAGQCNLMTDLVGRTVSFGKDNKKVFPGLALKLGIIEQRGAWYYIGEGEDKRGFQGLDALQGFLAENPAVVRALRSEMSKRLRLGVA
jgi:RecA/RadA recombinase